MRIRRGHCRPPGPAYAPAPFPHSHLSPAPPLRRCFTPNPVAFSLAASIGHGTAECAGKWLSWARVAMASLPRRCRAPTVLQRLLRGFVSSLGGLSLSRPLLPPFASPAVSDSRPEFAFKGGGRRLRPFLGAAPFSSASPASPRRRSIPDLAASSLAAYPGLALLSERAHGWAWMLGSLRPGSPSAFRCLICGLHPFAVAGLECPVP